MIYLKTNERDEKVNILAINTVSKLREGISEIACLKKLSEKEKEILKENLEQAIEIIRNKYNLLYFVRN